MYERFTDRARKVMQLANKEAQRFNHEYIGTEHILLGLIEEGSGVAANVLKNLDIDLRKIRLEVEKIVQSGPEAATMDKLPQTPRMKKVIDYSIEEARKRNHNYVGTEHLLLGLLRDQDTVAGQILMNLGLRFEDVCAEVLILLGHDISPGRESTQAPSKRRKVKQAAAMPPSGCDVTALARQGQLEPVFSRDEEIGRLLEIVLRPDHNHVALIGLPDVGKAAIVEGFAQLVVEGKLPGIASSRRLLCVDLIQWLVFVADHSSSLRAKRNFLTFLAKAAAERAIVYLGHFLSLSNLSSSGPTIQINPTIQIEQELLPYLVKGELPFIASFTPEQFQFFSQQQVTLAAHFQPIHIQPLSRDATATVLEGLRGRYETEHRVRIQDEAFEAAIELSDQLLPDALFPRKAIELLDAASDHARTKALRKAFPNLADVESQLFSLNIEKEAAVAVQDFETAAHLRDQAEKLKKTRARFYADADVRGIVDRETVAEVFGLRKS